MNNRIERHRTSHNTHTTGRSLRWCLVLCVIAGGAWSGLTVGSVLAQEPETATQTNETPSTAQDQAQSPSTGGPAQPVDTSNPAQGEQKDQTQVPTAEVIEVSGSVDKADAGLSPLIEEGWTPVDVGDRLPSGTQLRTGLRSHVNLRFGETTVMSIRSATHASIDEFYRSATSENVRIGLGYGAVRGSSSEGVLRSDVTVDSTVATLAKRGTEGWEMSVEPMTGRFRISLAQSGLVEAIRKLQGQRTVSRTVLPGEYATPNNIANMWIAQAVFDRNVTFYEASTVTASDAEFSAYNTSGLSVVAPGAGSQLANVSRRADAGALIRQARGDLSALPPNTAVIQPGLLPRPEGNFGTPNTFRVLLPGSPSPAAERAIARPGVRRSR